LLLQAGVYTPKTYYIGVEDYGRRNPVLQVLGFLSGFKSVLLFEDLSVYEGFKVNDKMPEEHAIATAKKLAQLHAAYWDSQIKPIVEVTKDPAFLDPTVYQQYFALKTNFLTKYPSKEVITKRLG